MISQTQPPISSGKATSLRHPQRISLVYQNSTIMLPVDDIAWLEGAGNYTFIHTRDKRRYLMARTLKTFQNELNSQLFLRIHKSYFVNVTYIRHINGGENAFVEMLCGKTLAIARRRINDTFRHYATYWQRATLN